MVRIQAMNYWENSYTLRNPSFGYSCLPTMSGEIRDGLFQCFTTLNPSLCRESHQPWFQKASLPSGYLTSPWRISYKWWFIAGNIIYFYGPFSMAMLNNQRVYVTKPHWTTIFLWFSYGFPMVYVPIWSLLHFQDAVFRLHRQGPGGASTWATRMRICCSQIWPCWICRIYRNPPTPADSKGERVRA